MIATDVEEICDIETRFYQAQKFMVLYENKNYKLRRLLITTVLYLNIKYFSKYWCCTQNRQYQVSIILLV